MPGMMDRTGEAPGISGVPRVCPSGPQPVGAAGKTEGNLRACTSSRSGPNKMLQAAARSCRGDVCWLSWWRAVYIDLMYHY